ncbi:MAG: penicillin-binding protein 2 [Methylococcales bacterium]|nr:penicillin-binding protein 2 [Methylococcales bacterium]
MIGLMLLVMAALWARAFQLQVLDKAFLINQGDLRHVSAVTQPASRGMIVDRNQEPLAISTPVESIWINPSEMDPSQRLLWRQLAELLAINPTRLDELAQQPKRKFAYLQRRIPPHQASRVKQLGVSGVYSQREFKRFYPNGASSAQLVGFTNIENQGQEGVELAFNAYLNGIDGRKRVIRDGKRDVIADIESIQQPQNGQDLVLSIDSTVQYLAYRELQAQVLHHQAKAGSLILLDAQTGEILADANFPSFNPNRLGEGMPQGLRNRSVIDIFEPGSTVKPFVIAAALEGGYVRPDTIIETNRQTRIGRNWVRDVHNYGNLDLTGVLKKSSNVAVSLIALKMPRPYFWSVYDHLGFGHAPGTGFPAEASGSVLSYDRWNDFIQSTLAFGYSLNTSLLQLARAYTALADNGVLHSVSLLRRNQDPNSKRIFSATTTRKIRAMLAEVVSKQGTAYRAHVEGYRVAGKTGTVKKTSPDGGYTKKDYFAVFVGMAPAENPRLVMAVMIDQPSEGGYYGGLVAAPVFANVMAGALRRFGIAPDQEDNMPILLARH